MLLDSEPSVRLSTLQPIPVGAHEPGGEVGPPGQPDYLNAALGLWTQLSPEALLAALHETEARAGGDSGSGVEAYHHIVDVNTKPSFARLTFTEHSGCCSEVTWFALYSAITGQGSVGCPPPLMKPATSTRVNDVTSIFGAMGVSIGTS